MRDLVTSSTEAALAVQLGDLDIAGNQLKISAWLATIATAGLYFCFDGKNNNFIFLSNSFSRPLFYPHIAISFNFGFSLISAYKFHIAHNHFCALSRNTICGYKIQLASLLQKIEDPVLLKALKKDQEPLWALVTTGEILKLVDSNTGNLLENILAKLDVYRKSVDNLLSLQKRLTLAGFLLLIITNAHFLIK